MGFFSKKSGDSSLSAREEQLLGAFYVVEQGIAGQYRVRHGIHSTASLNKRTAAFRSRQSGKRPIRVDGWLVQTRHSPGSSQCKAGANTGLVDCRCVGAPLVQDQAHHRCTDPGAEEELLFVRPGVGRARHPVRQDCAAMQDRAAAALW